VALLVNCDQARDHVQMRVGLAVIVAWKDRRRSVHADRRKRFALRSSVGFSSGDQLSDKCKRSNSHSRV
jgi:hypothetical protein